MKAWKIVLITLAGTLAFFVLIAAVSIRLLAGFTLPSITRESPIAVVYLSGEISSGGADDYDHNWMLQTLDEIAADEDNVAMLLVINTPGGGVYECDEIYERILDYRALGRPVYVSMGECATSGGYYVSAPCDKIYANRNTLTGSIGILCGTLLDVSGFLSQHGIRATEIKSGKNKAMGSLFEPYTDEQVAILQSIANESYEQFIDVVASGRGMEADAVRALADGRMYTARQALALGLIDGIATQEQVEAQMVSDLQLSNPVFYDYEYVREFRWTDLFTAKSDTADELSSMIAMIKKSSMLPAYLAPIG